MLPLANITVKGGGTINGGDLASQIKRITNACDAEILAATKEAGKIVSENTARNLRATSPKRSGAAYAKSWKAKFLGGTEYVVYNEKHYRLTHLLENGHDLISHGKKVGRVKAYPHIKKAETRAIEEYIDEVTKEVNRRLGQ